MNILPTDAFNKVCLFLDAISLANLSSVNRSGNFFLRDASSWKPSELKPDQALTSKDKIVRCLQAFLENLTIDGPSRFFVVSPNGSIQLKIDVFCSKGNPILPVRDFNLNLSIPDEPGPLNPQNRHCFVNYNYRHPQQTRLLANWGEYYQIEFRGTDHYEKFVPFLERSIKQCIDQLKANDNKSIIQRLQLLPAESQDPFIVNHNVNLVSSGDFDEHFKRGIRLAQGMPLKNVRSKTCIQTALNIAKDLVQNVWAKLLAI